MIEGENKKIWLLEALWCIEHIPSLYLKNSGRRSFFAKAYFSLLQCCQLFAHGCQKWDIDIQFEMGDRIDTISICAKFGDETKSILDFSFIFWCTPKCLISLYNDKQKPFNMFFLITFTFSSIFCELWDVFFFIISL